MVCLGFEPGAAGWKARNNFAIVKTSKIWDIFDCGTIRDRKIKVLLIKILAKIAPKK